MLRLAANISTMFTEVSLPDRFAAAAKAGFAAVEIQFPYAYPAALLAQAREAAAIEVVLINLPAGNLEAGDLGLACLPDCVPQFRESLHTAIDYAAALGCCRVNCLGGLASSPDCWSTLVENVGYAASMLQSHDITLLVEMINRVDRPAFILNSLRAADQLLDEIGNANLALQFDLYHVAMNGDDWQTALGARLQRIGHIQFSDVPGRGPPGTGKIDFPAFFSAIAQSAYRGWVSAEYRPLGPTTESLAWRDRL